MAANIAIGASEEDAPNHFCIVLGFLVRIKGCEC